MYTENLAFASLAALRAAAADAPQGTADVAITNPGDGLTEVSFFAYIDVLDVGEGEPLLTRTYDYFGALVEEPVEA